MFFFNLPKLFSKSKKTTDFNDTPESELIERIKKNTGLRYTHESTETLQVEYPFTSFTQSTVMIDYIWYTSTSLNYSGFLSLPNSCSYGPSSFHPSDHIPIQAFFSFIS